MNIQADPDAPSSESFTDCAGVRRHFELDVRHLPNHGHAAEALGVTTGDHGGYVFKAFAEASGTMAMGRLRIKVRQGLAQRFLIKEGSTMEMPFERIRGRIDAERVVVDGRLFTWDEFQGQDLSARCVPGKVRCLPPPRGVHPIGPVVVAGTVDLNQALRAAQFGVQRDAETRRHDAVLPRHGDHHGAVEPGQPGRRVVPVAQQPLHRQQGVVVRGHLGEPVPRRDEQQSGRELLLSLPGSTA